MKPRSLAAAQDEFPASCRANATLARQTTRNPPTYLMQKLRHHHILDRAKSFLSCWISQASDASFAGLLPAVGGDLETA